MRESHELFERKGLKAYAAYQVARENEPFEPGVAFPLVDKLLSLNGPDIQHAGVEVILVSRNSADTGLRIFNSIEHYGLDIERAAFTSGESREAYLRAYDADLFLSTHHEDVRRTLEAGFAAALILPGTAARQQNRQLRIAFDGDAVLFADESERIYQERGLDAFAANETEKAQDPLPGGPFKPVLEAIHDIQAAYPPDDNPIRTALVTARSAPAHKRVILTLRHWGIRIDEALFLGGRSKGEFLKAFGADIFFDDQQMHVVSASEHVAAAHVPHGVANE